MAQLVVVLIALFAQIERTYSLERAACARAAATAKGQRLGRPSVVDADKFPHATHLRATGHTIAEIVTPQLPTGDGELRAQFAAISEQRRAHFPHGRAPITQCARARAAVSASEARWACSARTSAVRSCCSCNSERAMLSATPTAPQQAHLVSN